MILAILDKFPKLRELTGEQQATLAAELLQEVGIDRHSVENFMDVLDTEDRNELEAQIENYNDDYEEVEDED
jgi:hypothetical protein